MPSLFGQEGEILDFLDRIVPGAQVYLIIIAIIIFVTNAYRGKNLTEKKWEPWTYLVIFAFVMMVLTKDYSVLMGSLVLFFLVQFSEAFYKREQEYGTSAEKKAAQKAGISPYQYRALIRRLKRLERQKGKGIAKTVAKEETASAKASEGEAEQLHQEAAALGFQKEVAETAKELVTKEENLEKNEEKINAQIEVIDNTLSKVSDSNVINEESRNYALKMADALVQSLGELIKDEKYKEEYTKKALERFKKCDKQIEKTTRFAVNLGNKAKSSGTKRGALVMKNVAELDRLLAEYEVKLKKANGQLNRKNATPETKTKYAQIIADLKKEQEYYLQEKGALKAIEASINKAIDEVQKIIATIDKEVTVIKKDALETNKYMKPARVFETKFKSVLKEMAENHSNFSKAVKDLEKGGIPEAIISQVIGNVTKIYSQLIGLTTASIQLNKDTLKPFLERYSQMAEKYKDLTKSTYFVEFFEARIVEALEKLDQMTAAAIKMAGENPKGGKKGKTTKKQIDTVLEKEKVLDELDKFVAKESQDVYKEAEAIIGEFKQAVAEVDQHNQFLVKEIETLRLQAGKITNSLTNFLKAITKNKERAHEEFMKAASEIGLKMGKVEAAEKVAEAAAKEAGAEPSPEFS